MTTPDGTLDELLTLMELGRLLTSTLDLEPLYEEIVEQVQRAFEPDTVSLMLIMPQKNSLCIVAHRGLSDVKPGTEVKLDRNSIAGYVALEGEPLVLLGGLQGSPFARFARRHRAIASAMSIPLQVQDTTLGVINLNRFRGQANYSERNAHLLHIFAAQIAIALQNARLYASVRQERDRIIAAQEVVRRELARDLHDGLSQVLAAMSQSVALLQMMLKPGQPVPEAIGEDLDYLQTAVRQAIQDAKTLTFGLRPLVLETQGIVPAMRQYIGTIQKGDRTTQYSLDVSRCPRDVALSLNEARMIFAILQEAINNARKHAKAKEISITLIAGDTPDDPFLTATVRDDGRGFDLPAIANDYEERLSFGLNTMQERARLIDATLAVESNIGQGTQVTLTLPYRST